MNELLRSAGMRGYTQLLQRLGCDPQPLLRKHGLPEDLGEDENAMVSMRAIIALMEESAALTGCADLGLQLASLQDVQILGPLATAIEHSNNVREALQTSSRYLFVHSPALIFSVFQPSKVFPDAVELRIEISLSQVASRRQTIDQCLGVLHRLVAFFAGENYRLHAVTLPHTPLSGVEKYTRFFNAQVYPDQEYAALHISPKTLSSGLSDVNSSLRAIALEYLERHYGAPDQTITERVKRALQSTLSSTGGAKTTIADLLFMHPRTLQRKLTAEGTTFESIRDTVRREAAERYLKETRIPLAQLASLLDLADQSVLTRLCLRWFNMPPSKIRLKQSPQ